MPKSFFDYEGARNEGYSDEDITTYLTESEPDFDVQGALNEGYSIKEVNDFISSEEPKKEERSFIQKAGRVGAQYALGAAESALLPYEIASIPVGTVGFHTNSSLERMGEDIELLYEKNAGKSFDEWSKEDKEFYNFFEDRIKNPSKIEEEVKPVDISVRGLTEKATGLDLSPEGILEKGAHWAGFIKDPKKLFELGKTGLKATDAIKAIAPTGKEALRGAGAGLALQLAENGGFGPIGTMAAAVIGDISGSFGAGVGKIAKRIATEPKKVLAEIGAKFTKNDKLDLQKQIIKDFKSSNLQADIGTLTDSEIVKWVQARLAQSGLTGDALDNLKNKLTEQIKNEYKAVADSLGEAKFVTSHEAGQATKETIEKIREADLAATRQLYKSSTEELTDASKVDSRKLASIVTKIENELAPGAVKSTEQKAVLKILEDIKNDVFETAGGKSDIKPAKVKDLINNKIALNDIINYEIEGGTKQLLKQVVKELDRSIISYGVQNKKFANNYIKANQRFSKHAKTFRNKGVTNLLKTEDPAKLLNKMDSVHGIREVGKILNMTPQGKELFDSLKRFKMDEKIGKNLLDSTTQQVKFGTFSKLLEKGQNRALFKEMLGPENFKRLELLQRNSGRLAGTAEKFYNASKSGATAADTAIIFKIFTDLGYLLSGNVWPIANSLGGLVGARYLTHLISDPHFLKLVEESILAAEKNNVPLMKKLGAKLVEEYKGVLSNIE